MKRKYTVIIEKDEEGWLVSERIRTSRLPILRQNNGSAYRTNKRKLYALI